MTQRDQGMSERGREIVTHALGLDNSKRAYRNHFTASSGSADHAECVELCRTGLMRKYAYIEQRGQHGRLLTYHVTDAGRAAIGPEASCPA